MPSEQSDGRFLRGQTWEKFSAEKAQADFYVAPDGDDAWSGTLPVPNTVGNDGPFATIQRAQEAVRQLKQRVYSRKKPPAEKRFIGSPHQLGAGRDILVLIRAGYYSLEKPLRFGPDDGGERIETDIPTGAFEFHKLKDHFVTYAAYPGETPVISGGRNITDWREENGKWVAEDQSIDVTRLLANGKTQTLARAPNSGYFTPPYMPDSDQEFTFREGDLSNWPNMENNRIIMLLRWHQGVNSIAQIDTENNIVRLAEPQPGIVVVPPRYYIENVETLLDAPGEWFFRDGKLSYIPEESIDDPNEANIVTPVLSQLMVVMGEPGKPVRNLRFYGLSFEATNPGESAISFTYAANCEFVDSEIRGVGNTALLLGKGCYLNRILNNSIHGADEGGIRVSGDPHPVWADLVHGNVISHNHVADCHGTSIHVSNTRDTVISHNEITNTRGRTPLQVGGWSNVEVAIEGGYRVEYNHIHHVQVGSDDSGAITTAGLTTDSIIRGNLIHDVSPGFFNENVAFWFDNMSSGWTVTENIYYNLKQSEMKLCACLLEDNIYQDNFLIDTPDHDPEEILEGKPEFSYSELEIQPADGSRQDTIWTGQVIRASAAVTNIGATGVGIVDLYLDGKVAESRKFAVIHSNTRRITFDVIFREPGEHQIAVGSAPYGTVKVNGEPLQLLCTDLKLSASVIPLGQNATISAIVKNVSGENISDHARLYMDGEVVDSQHLVLSSGESQPISFVVTPDKGVHRVSISKTAPVTLQVYPHHLVDMTKHKLRTHCSATARPCEFSVDPVNNRYSIIAGGTDFLHAEDSYGAIYLKGVAKGNFITTLKVVSFEENVNPWYRAGIFARNDISQSYETAPGSLGSVLIYATPKLCGIQWDEFGDGCMHTCGERSLYETQAPFPVWLKLVRHGDSFTGYLSYDGVNWGQAKHTASIPGLADTVDVGMAAGTIDQIPTKVVLEDFTLEVEDEDWRDISPCNKGWTKLRNISYPVEHPQ